MPLSSIERVLVCAVRYAKRYHDLGAGVLHDAGGNPPKPPAIEWFLNSVCDECDLRPEERVRARVLHELRSTKW